MRAAPARPDARAFARSSALERAAAPGRARVHHTRRGASTRALEPNREWPPADVWEDFCAAHAGEWVGARASLHPRSGLAVASHARDARDGETSRANALERRIVARGETRADGDALRLTTADADADGRGDGGFADARVEDVCGGGQMGKMFIVQGCYAHGPSVLPECVDGAEARFAFAFAEEDAPDERRRVNLTVRAAPGRKRNWELSEIEVTHEVRGSSSARAESPATGEILPEWATSAGEWRADGGVTFIALEALADVPEDRAESTSEANLSDGPAQALARQKPEDSALARAAAAEKEAAEARARAELEAATREPEGLIVVPWWAVKSPTSWSMAGEYVLGGNSPLVFLPNNMWVLVESVDNQLVVECGRYDQGAPSFELDDTERRVIARRYRKGRFASAFFVRERRLDPREREEEADEYDIFDEDLGLADDALYS